MKNPAFISYARGDSEFVLRLAGDLKARDANVWLDQLDIRPGQPWDGEVERALTACSEMLVILSPASVESRNVMDEVAFALEEGKTVIPVLHRDCKLPFRLRRLHYVDVRIDYGHGLEKLLRTLAPGQRASPPVAALAASAASSPLAETAPRVVRTRVNRKDGLTYVWIPPGAFMMGCSPADNDATTKKNPHTKCSSRGGSG